MFVVRLQNVSNVLSTFRLNTGVLRDNKPNICTSGAQLLPLNALLLWGLSWLKSVDAARIFVEEALAEISVQIRR